MSRPYAEVIGDPIRHSKSPLIHNFWLGKLGIDAEYRACHVKPDELADYFTRRRGDANWRGCNITMPHKISSVQHLDRQSGLATKIGAINLITRDESSQLEGDNTDVVAISRVLEDIESCDGPSGRKMVDLIGAGGAARAAMVALMPIYPETTVWARDIEKAEALSDELGIGCGYHGSLDRLAEPAEKRDVSGIWGHLIINASPLGMKGNPPLDIFLDFYPDDTFVFDMVYQPLETPLLAAARARGMRTVDGLTMLIGQAATAFERFFGAVPPREHDAELRALLTA